MKEPAPKHVQTVCDLCGLDWSRHLKKTAEECVELLKKDLASAQVELAQRRAHPPCPPVVNPIYPRILPYPQPGTAKPFPGTYWQNIS